MKKNYYIILCLIVFFQSTRLTAQAPPCFSGVYPSLAFYNDEGECGTGCLVPWNNYLWAVTYGPHLPFGSSDKLYQISPSLTETVRIESVGGTNAGRMIHNESRQLFIGPYVIDSVNKVRVISPISMPGRLTGIARNLSSPANYIDIATMEQGFYRVNVNNLKVTTLFKDGNVLKQEGASTYQRTLCKGVHGKGFYSGQGVYVYSNNGEDSPEALVNPKIESGSLSEFKQGKWNLIRRNQFTEVTGPGGIYGNSNPSKDPIWSIGWDNKSIIIGVRDAQKGWKFLRAPKASNSYDGAHGWNTEWPRIRKVGNEYLMTMHGMFWHWPGTFSYNNIYGLRPFSNYLKVIGDFCLWNNRLVFGCDDSARSEFLNKRKAKGNIAGPGQSNSNLWFTSVDRPAHNGTSDAMGCIWENDSITANVPSEPFMLAGWSSRRIWIQNQGSKTTTFHFEVDKKGDGHFKKAISVKLHPYSSRMVAINNISGEWIRCISSSSTKATIAFVYGDTKDRLHDESLFQGLSLVSDSLSTNGLLYALGGNRRKLGILSGQLGKDSIRQTGYYELDADMQLKSVTDEAYASFIRSHMAIPKHIVETVKGSYLLVDDQGRRWRFPLGNHRYEKMYEKGYLRICREVATERDLFSLGGTFYELPAENADGFAKIRPISSHNFLINDYASYRGMLVMTGLKADANSSHIVSSTDGKCKLWCGEIDDLFRLGKPKGEGGPWVDTEVKAGKPSDPYLLSHYDKKELTLTNKGKQEIMISIEIDPTGDSTWMTFDNIKLSPGQTIKKTLPRYYLGRWIRFTSNKDSIVSAWLIYN